MSSKGIHLSPKHGVNPMLVQCFFCGGDAGIALVGRLPNDAEAPRKGVIDDQPCQSCEDLMKQGIMLISVDEGKTTDMRNPYRTGNMCVLRDEALERLINSRELFEQIVKKRVAFVPDAAWALLGLPTSEPPKAEPVGPGQ